MIRYTIAIVGVLVFAVGIWAQSPPAHHHSVAPVTVIDGAKNPELIPDDTAFRLWLITVSTQPNPASSERERQMSHLVKINFSNVNDYVALSPILTEFKSQYTALIKNYNDAQTAIWARGAVPDPSDLKLFLQQRDDLVAATRRTIANQLTFKGNTELTAHVQAEKKKMQIHVSKEGQ